MAASLNDPDVQLEQIEQLIAHDVALSFRLLRYVNSAFFGLRGDVRSIGQALALLGLENVKRWSTLSVLASIDDKPTELTVTALIRARFCELAGEAARDRRARRELFTLGLFSVLDAMMDAPMIDVVASLPLAAEMRDALVSRKGKRGLLLECVAALETGEVNDLPSGRRRRRRAVPRSDDVGEQPPPSRCSAPPPRARAPRARHRRCRSRPPLPLPALAPAPVSDPVDAGRVEPETKRGPFARAFAKLSSAGSGAARATSRPENASLSARSVDQNASSSHGSSSTPNARTSGASGVVCGVPFARAR